VIAAIDVASGFESVAQHTRSTGLTRRRQRLYRALEAVEYVCVSVHGDLKGLVIIVAASFTYRHCFSLASFIPTTFPPRWSGAVYCSILLRPTNVPDHGCYFFGETCFPRVNPARQLTYVGCGMTAETCQTGTLDGASRWDSIYE
jgi:hypothetical protein